VDGYAQNPLRPTIFADHQPKPSTVAMLPNRGRFEKARR
jgi:hypothetical protein